MLYFTYDRKFLLKQLNKAEKNLLIEKVMPKLQDHIEKTENKSMIARIYGLFTLKMGQ